MTDSLLIEILRLAIQKTNEAYLYYEEQAKYCTGEGSKQFLLYLAEKKKNKLLPIKNIVQSAGINFYTIMGHDNNRLGYLNIYSTALYESTINEIYSFALSFGEKEVDFYKFLIGIKRSPLISLLIETLIDLAQDYIVEIREGYLISFSQSQKRKSEKHLRWFAESGNLVA